MKIAKYQQKIKLLKKQYLDQTFKNRKQILKQKETFQNQIFKLRLQMMQFKSLLQNKLLEQKNLTQNFSQKIHQQLESQNEYQNQQFKNFDNIQQNSKELIRKENEFLKAQLKIQRNQFKQHQNYQNKLQDENQQLKSKFQKDIQRAQIYCKQIVQIYHQKLLKIADKIQQYELQKNQTQTTLKDINYQNQEIYLALKKKHVKMQNKKNHISLSPLPSKVGNFSVLDNLSSYKKEKQYSSYTQRSNYMPKRFMDDKNLDKQTKQMMSQLQDLKSLQQTILGYNRESKS